MIFEEQILADVFFLTCFSIDSVFPGQFAALVSAQAPRKAQVLGSLSDQVRIKLNSLSTTETVSYVRNLALYRQFCSFIGLFF